jgi:GrpB-like predicted nucleotidyltransferase (UPF0157 family)
MTDDNSGFTQRVKRNLAARTWKYVQNYADARSELVAEILAGARMGT